MSDADPKRRGKLALRLIGFLIAATLVAVVVYTVPWRDALHVSVKGADTEVYSGEIDGSWRDEGPVKFLFDPGQEPGPLLVGTGIGDRLSSGGEVVVLHAADRLEAEGDTFEAEVEARPGMPRAFRDMDRGGILPALGFLLLASLFIITRWWRLLLIAGCPTSWFEAFRLTYVGMFFNTVIPGATGGDLVRAYVVVQGHKDRRADALTSVAADRVLGLFGMAVLSTIALWTSDTEGFQHLRFWVLAAMLSIAGGLMAMVSPLVRRLVRFDAILERLPQAERLKKIDTAVCSYAKHPIALLFALVLSMGNHLCSTACCYAIGHAFGDTHGFHDYLCVVTVANTVAAIPLSPGGLGVGEVAFGTLLSFAGGLYMIGVATSFVYRLSLALLGLGGGLVLLLPGGAQVRSGYAEVRGQEPADPPSP